MQSKYDVKFAKFYWEKNISPISTSLNHICRTNITNAIKIQYQTQRIHEHHKFTSS